MPCSCLTSLQPRNFLLIVWVVLRYSTLNRLGIRYWQSGDTFKPTVLDQACLERSARLGTIRCDIKVVMS